MAYMEPFGVTGPTGVQELDRLVREEHIYRYSQPLWRYSPLSYERGLTIYLSCSQSCSFDIHILRSVLSSHSLSPAS